MSRFISANDVKFFQSINRELINDVIETEISIFKSIPEDSNPEDIYGESVDRSYYSGITINCIIDRSSQDSKFLDQGVTTIQSFVASINRLHAVEKNIIPEVGDIVWWNGFYYEISNTNENQYIAGRKEDDYNWSYIITAQLTNTSFINITERLQ